MTSNLLTAMVESARRSAAERACTGATGVEHAARDRSPQGAAFRAGLEAPGIRIIAECKRRSPSRGVLRQSYDAPAIATSYERAGAAAISVLTEPSFFDGSLADLEAVRAAVRLPLLRKDFIVTDFQILEARASGADAVLLIVSALDDKSLRRLIAYASELALAVLAEVHDVGEVARACDAGASIVGVNSRNLRTLEVNTRVFEELAPELPATIVAVAESGLKSAEDLSRLSRGRYDAFLIGERFMTEPDPGLALRDLLAPAERSRRASV